MKTTTGIAAVLVAAAGTGGLVYLSQQPAESGEPAGGSPPAATAEVTRQTLTDTESHDGALAYADTTTVRTKLTGTVTALAAAGATVKRGGQLFRIDNDPVVLLYGSLPGYRPLSPGAEGADVKQFEKNLWALGYRGFTVDKEYTSATAGAVRRWQEDLGLAETGTLALGRAVYTPGPVRVDSRSAEPDDGVHPGSVMLQVSGLSRVATVELDIDDQRLARKGAAVEVTLPDGKRVPGRISQVQTSVQEAQDEGDHDTTKIDVTISFGRTPAGLDEAAVSVDFVVSRVEDVLTVPVNALVALAEGGYGLQIVDGGTTRLLAVTTGLFAGGRVEVTGAGLAAGMKAGVPG